MSDAAGLSEDSPVTISGVTVGKVASVKVVQGKVDVSFEIDRKHEVTLRREACALAMPGMPTGAPALVVTPGEGPALAKDTVIEQCKPYGQALELLRRTLGVDMSEWLKRFGQGLHDAQSTAAAQRSVTPSSAPAVSSSASRAAPSASAVPSAASAQGTAAIPRASSSGQP